MPGIYTDVTPADMPENSNTGVTRPDTSGAAQPPAAQPVPPPDFTGKGKLLEEPDDTKVFNAVHSIVKRQEPLAKNREAQAKHWSRVRRGVPFSTLEKTEDRAEWKATLPPGVQEVQQPVPNKADDLCSRITSQVIVDPFMPDPKPENDDEKARHAAELAKKWLTSDGDESGTNDAEGHRDAIDRSHTKSSAFAYFWLDDKGDGWRPLQIMAAPDAIDPSNPLVGQNGAPSSDYRLRYVTADGQFTENAAEADMQWMPKLRRTMLNPSHVRTVPETADIHSADATVLLLCEAYGTAKRMVPELAEMADDQLAALAAWRPPRHKVLVPPSLKSQFKRAEEKDNEKSVSDDTLLFWYVKFCRQGQDYPDGAEIHVSGANGGLVLKKATLRDDITLADNTVKPIVRVIPVSQMKSLHDSEDGDPFGRPMIEKFAGANEAYAQIFGAVLEDVDRKLHPNVFIPSTSPVQGWMMTQRTGDPIMVLSKEDQPFYEQFSELPTFLPSILEMLDQAGDNASGLNDTAKGLEVSTSTSGKAKEIAVQQAKVALSSVYQNFAQFAKRSWRIKIQIAQAKLTVPQQVEVTGTDSAYKQRYWSGSDFVGVKDVAIQAGTGTMQSPAEKQNYLMMAQQMGWLDPEECAEVGRSTLADDLGLKSNPHEERINRDIQNWLEGPPDGWMPAMPMMDPATGVAAVDPMTGQPAMQPPSSTPFDPRPNDDDPIVAHARYRVLRTFVSTGDYAKHPPEWRTLVDEVYLQARQAAGIQTIAEQQAAMQQQAMMQQDQQNQDRDQQSNDKAQDRQFQANENQQDRQNQNDMAAQKNAVAMQPKAAA